MPESRRSEGPERGQGPEGARGAEGSRRQDDEVGPTGRRLSVTSPDGRATAEIAQVGAALRRLVVDGVEHVPTYPDGMPTPSASGLVLVPWPNRVRDGEWTWEGVARQLAITEPKLGNASHGLLRFTAYRVIEERGYAVTLAADVFPQTGWPFHLSTEVAYTAVSDGLEVTHRITSRGPDPAPVALGTHPYLQIGGAPTSELTLRLPAETWFETDERSLPIAQRPVDEAHDLRAPRRLGDLALDTAFGDIARDADDRIRAVLQAPDGRTLTLWMGPGFDYAQVFTTDRYPGQPLAVAIEPMTAPADALRSGQSVRVLDPGETWTLSWGIRVGAARSGFDTTPQETLGSRR